MLISNFQLHEVALKYHSCQNESDVDSAFRSDIVSRYRRYKWESISRHLDLAHDCRPTRRERNYPSSSHYESLIPVVHRCCISVVLDGMEPSKYNSCDVCVNYYSTNFELYQHSCGRLTLSTSRTSSFFRPFDLSLNECSVIMPNYNPNEYVSMCCDNDFHYFITRKKHSLDMSSHIDSLVSPSSTSQSNERRRTPLHKHSDRYVRWAVKNYRKKTCQKLRKQRLNEWSPVYDMNNLGFEDSKESLSVNITGLGCENNHSLTFLAMDSNDSDMFARNLGFDVNLRRNESLLVLVDKEVSLIEH